MPKDMGHDGHFLCFGVQELGVRGVIIKPKCPGKAVWDGSVGFRPGRARWGSYGELADLVGRFHCYDLGSQHIFTELLLCGRY